MKQRVVAKILTASPSLSPPECPNSDEGCVAAHAALRHDTGFRRALLDELIAQGVRSEADEIP